MASADTHTVICRRDVRECVPVVSSLCSVRLQMSISICGDFISARLLIVIDWSQLAILGAVHQLSG